MSLNSFSPIFNLGKSGKNKKSAIFTDYFKDLITSAEKEFSKVKENFSMSTFLFGDKKKRDAIRIPKIIDKETATQIINTFKESDIADAAKFVDRNINNMFNSVTLPDGTTKVIDDNAEALKAYSKEVEKSAMTVEGLTGKSIELAKIQEKLKNSFSAKGLLGKGADLLKTFGSAMLNMGVTMLASAALTGIIKLVDEIINRQEKIIERGKEAQKLISEYNEAYNTKKDFTDENTDRYTKLREGIGTETNENLQLSTNEYEEFLDLNNQLADLFPELVIGYDAQGNALLDLSGNAGAAADQIKALVEQERQLADFKIAESLQTNFEGVFEESKIINKQLQELYKKRDELALSKSDIAAGESGDLGAISKTLIKSDPYQDVFGNSDLHTYKKIIDTASESGELIQEAFANAANEANLLWTSDHTIDGQELMMVNNVTKEQADVFIEAYSRNLKGLAAEAKGDISAELEDTLKEISVDERELNALWNSFTPSLISSMQIYDGYDELSDEIKQMINSAIKNIDFENLGKEDRENIRQYARKTLLDPILDMDGETESAFNEIVDIYSNGEKSINEKVAAILETSKKEGVDEEAINKVLSSWGIKTENGYDVTGGKLDEILSRDNNVLSAEMLKSMSGKEFSVYYDLVVNKDKSFKNAEHAIKEVERLVNNVAAASKVHFSDLLGVDSEGNQSAFSKAIDDFQTKITSIQDTLTKLKNGEDVDLTDLIQQFPELAGKTDDLNSALSKLEVDTLRGFKDSWKKAVAGLTGDDLKKAEESLKNLLRGVDLSGVSDADLRQNIFDNLFSGNESDRGYISQKVRELISQFGGSHEALEVLAKISINPTAITWNEKEWQAQIKKNMPEIEFRESNKQVELLDKRVTSLKSIAQQTQDEISLRQAQGLKPTIENYEQLISNSKLQVRELERENAEYALQKKYLQENGQDYSSVQSKIEANNSAINQLRISQVEWNKAIKALPVEYLQNKISDLQSEAKNFENALSLKDAQGIQRTADDYDALIEKSKDEVALLEKENTLLSKQQSEVNPLSEEYKTLQSQIDSNNNAIVEAQKNQIEWNKSIENIPINNLGKDLSDLQAEAQKVQDAMSLDDARGIKATSTQYRELISNSEAQIAKMQQQNELLQVQKNHLIDIGADYSTVESQINANVSAIDAARVAQEGWNEALAQLDYQPNEGLMAYNKAKSTRNAGDNYLDMLNAAKEAQEAREKGLIGTDDFKTVAKMFSPNGMNNATNWDENYGKIQKYFTEDETGVISFLEDLESKTNKAGESLAVFDEETSAWSYNIDDIQGSADALGISFEAFLAVMGRLQDYGFTNDFFSSIEDGEAHISNLYTELGEAETKMRQLEKDRANGDATVTDAVLSEQEARVNQIKQSILESQDLLNQLIGKSAADYEEEYKGKMSTLVQRLNEAGEIADKNARDSYIQGIRDWAENENIDISDLFTADGNIDESALSGLAEKYQSELSKTSVYTDAASKEISESLKAGYENSESDIRKSIDSLSGYTQEQLSGITFGDGLTDEVLPEAESAIDRLLTSLGLGQESAQTLIQILAELGYIELKPDTTELDGAVTEAEKPIEKEVQLKVESGESTVDVTGQVEMTSPEGISVEVTAENPSAPVEQVQTAADSSPVVIKNQAETVASLDGDEDVKRDLDAVASKSESMPLANVLIRAKDEATSVISRVSSSLDNLNGKEARTYLTVVRRETKESSQASGTLIPALASGTAYNMLNMRPYASGSDVSLKKDETALVNELGTEALIRDGKLYEIPGGTHMQSLKRGDVVINAAQWAEIKKYGSTDNFAGTAYATGTLGQIPLMSAYANNYGSFNVSKPSSSSSAANNNNNLAQSIDKISTASKGAAKSLKSFQEWIGKLVDWVEVKIQREQEWIDLNLAKSENAKGFQNKNSYVTKAQDINKQLIVTNQKGEKEYLAQANRVTANALSAKLLTGKTKKDRTARANELIKRIQNGKINISQYGEKEREFITQYTEWYNKAMDCRQATEDLKAETVELAQTKLDNIIDQFDAMLAHVEHTGNMINESMEQSEAKGYVASTKYYDALIANEKRSIDYMTKERANLVASLQNSVNRGDIKLGTIEWLEMQNQIGEVSESIKEANGNIIDFQNSIRDAKWAIFDMSQDAIGRLVEESDFLIELMSNDKLFEDNGKMTEEGLSTIGLHGGNYDTYMKQADLYRDEMLRIQSELAKDPANTVLIERKNELLKLQRDSILAAEDEKQAIKSLVEDGINKELDSLKKLIDKYLEAIDSQKDLLDYQRDVADSAEEIAALQKKLSAYSGDNSEEGRLKKQQWQKELKDAQQNLQDKEYDHYISDQKKLLDDLYENYETVLNERLDNIDLLMEEMINFVNTNSDKVADTLVEQSNEVGYILTEEMKSIWGTEGAIATILTTYMGKFDNSSASILTAIGWVRDAVLALERQADENAGKEILNSKSGSENDPTVDSVTSGTKEPAKPAAKPAVKPTQKDRIMEIINSGVSDPKVIAKQKKDKHAKLWRYIVDKYHHIPTYNIYSQLAKELGIKLKGAKATSAEKDKILAALKKKGYATGVHDLKRDEMAWTQEGNRPEVIIRKSDGAVLTPLKMHDDVLEPKATENLIQAARYPRQFIQENGLGNLSNIRNNNSNIISNENSISITLPNVQSYGDFVTELQHDKRFEKMVQDMTLGRANGQGALGKYKRKF